MFIHLSSLYTHELTHLYGFTNSHQKGLHKHSLGRIKCFYYYISYASSG